MGYTTFNTGLSKSGITLSGGDLTATASGTSVNNGVAAVHSKISGKWYFEYAFGSLGAAGSGGGIRVVGSKYSDLQNNAPQGAQAYKTGSIFVNGSSQTGISTISSNTLCVAVDLDNKRIWFRTNGGNWNGNGSADPVTNTGGYDISAFAPGSGVYPHVTLDNVNETATANFGASAFAQTAPTGFVGWSDSHDCPVQIDLDSNATAQFSTTNSSSVTLPGTDGADRIIIVTVHADTTSGGLKTVSSISGASLTWNLHKQFTYNGLAGTGKDTVEIWWAHAASALGSTSITVTMSGTIDDATIACFAVAGANLTTPFDTDASIPSTNSNTASSAASVTGVSTVSANGILLGVWSNDNGPTSGGIPTQGSNYAEVTNRTNSGGTNWSLQMTEALAFKSARSSVTVATTGSRSNWGMIATAIVEPSASVSGTWASTEATDIFAGSGGVLGGTWASTETRDTFAAAGYPKLTGSWASTEAQDVFAGAGHANVGGTWASTEATDIFAATGPVQVIGTLDVTDTKDIFAGSGVPCPIGSLAVTEAKDTFAAAGYPRLRGTLAVTEVKDTFAGTGLPLLTGSWASTEVKDVFAGTGVVPSIGTLAVTEAQDVFAGVGEPPAAFGIDAHATGHAHDTTSASVAITTLYNNDVIVVGIFSGGFFNRAKVSSITDTSNLTWKKRNQRWQVGTNPDIEIWWAAKPIAGATTITVHMASTTGFLCLDALAIKGANYSTPWDTHTGAGWVTDNLGTGNPIATFYSNCSKVLALAFYGSNDGPSDGDMSHLQVGRFDAATDNPDHWTWLERVSDHENVGQTGTLESAYNFFGVDPSPDPSPLIARQVQFGGNFPGGFSSRNVLIAQDLIVAADDGSSPAASTDDLIRWFFDGHGNRNIVAMAGAANSLSQSFTSYNAGTIAVCAVMIQSATQARVDHIFDDAGHSPGWARRSIVTNDTGTLSLEVWWCHFPAAFAGNITVVADSNIRPGDILGFVVNGINGPDEFLRGEIWDGDASLPHTNERTGFPSYESVGPFSSLNENVLELNFVANTSTDPTGFNELPWLQFLGDFFGSISGELVSQAPAFNIVLDFKFSADRVDNDSIVAHVSPKPPMWLMIADVMPVGPPSPPTGSWHSTEAKDRTTNSGAFTAIGLNTSGWVGYVPAFATMAATDTKDITTNSGAFTAIWDIHGWIGYIPASAAMAAIEAKDIFLGYAWVLGPTTILARWESAEDRDRFGSSYLYTSYTTADSTGDRTSRITVTTNATLGSIGTPSGTPDRLVDGAKANGTASAIWVTAVQSQAMYFRFDFGTARVINEAKWYQNGPSAQPGVWKWQGSNNATTWTDLSATFTLDGGGAGTVIGNFSANATPYRYYQILQTTNAGGNDTPWLWEIEFKVEGTGASMAVTEFKDKANYQVHVIPIAHPIPARKRRLLIVT